MKPTVVIAGSLAQKPCQGGHTWQFLNYLLGWKRLGHDVLFIDRIEPEMCLDENGARTTFESSVNLEYVTRVMRAFGLQDQFCLIYNRGEKVAGISREAALRKTREALMLINVMGFLDDEDILAAASRRVLLDTDPGFGQMWQDLGLATLFREHDAYVTIAENIGRAGCTIPDCGIDWITWRQPVVLDQWPAQDFAAEKFTSIGSWRGPYAPVEHRGVKYGLRAHEFRKFVALPSVTGMKFEVALDIHSADAQDVALLDEHAWSVADPKVVAADPWVYRDYIQGSRAEFMATKGMYVQTHSGWFSERSICYLASGRPVLAQDTGLAKLYPLGEGIIAFNTLEEAAAGAREICADYGKHSRAARMIAEEYFDSDKMLPRLLEAAFASPPQKETTEAGSPR